MTDRAARVDVLFEGYLDRPDDRVASTVGLVRDGEAVVIVDPGLVPEPSSILAPLHDLGFRPEACDLTVLAARPEVGPRREEMRRNLAAALSVPVTNVSVKATRPEGLGLQGDGIGCMAVAQVVPIGSR